MLLNRVEYALMNNPVRAAVQRHVEARRLRQLGGTMAGGIALEIGCGRGVGAEIILDIFGAAQVDAFDLDPRMITQAQRRLENRGAQVRLWTGDVTAIPSAAQRYDAVFDFGIIHHVPNWRDALGEVFRVLQPDGRFYAEEAYTRSINAPVSRRLLKHPRTDRFDHNQFCQVLGEVGFRVIDSAQLWGGFGWIIADKLS